MRIVLTLIAWLLVVPFVAWAAVRLTGSESGFPLVALIAYTPYVGVAAVALALALVAVRRRLPATVAGLTALALLAGVADRAVADEEVAGKGPRLRVLSANVARGSVETRFLTRMIRDRRVDLLSLQELTPELAAQLRRGAAGELLPHAALRAGEGASGTGLMSRRPLVLRPMPTGMANRTAVATSRWPGFGSFDVLAVHPPPPTRSQVDGWGPDLRRLPRARASSRTRLLAGDFNATLDHGELRRLLASGYRDAAASAGSGLAGTWPSHRRLPPVAIDHVLVPASWRVVRAEVLDLPGSDHRAVLAELAPPPRS